MAKSKSRAELKEDLSAAKEELKVAKGELRDYEKTSKLAKGEDHSSDEKHGKKWTKMNDMVTKKQTAVDTIQEAYTAAKPEKVDRPSKYDYPADIQTAADKKKFRAKARAEKKRAEKGDAPKKEKKDKAVKAEKDVPTNGTAKKSKSERRAEKKAAAAVSED